MAQVQSAPELAPISTRDSKYAGCREGFHAEKHVLFVRFLLFKEKDGCFQEVGRKINDKLANFLDVFALESKIVG